MARGVVACVCRCLLGFHDLLLLWGFICFWLVCLVDCWALLGMVSHRTPMFCLLIFHWSLLLRISLTELHCSVCWHFADFFSWESLTELHCSGCWCSTDPFFWGSLHRTPLFCLLTFCWFLLLRISHRTPLFCLRIFHCSLPVMISYRPPWFCLLRFVDSDDEGARYGK